MAIQILTITAPTDKYDELLVTAGRLDQAKYISVVRDHYETWTLLGAFDAHQCVGFLRFVIQILGTEEGRTPIVQNDRPLREGYVEAFGVLPEYRRQGIGQCLQECAIKRCKEQGCFQMRSRSPVTSVENYALKIKMGYAIHPDHEHDSYYFIKTL